MHTHDRIWVSWVRRAEKEKQVEKIRAKTTIPNINKEEQRNYNIAYKRKFSLK